MPTLASVLQQKKWVWVGIATEEVWVSVAIVRLGYASHAFAFVHDLRARAQLAEATVIGPPFAARVAEDPEHLAAALRFRGQLTVAVEGAELVVRGRLGAVTLDAALGLAAPRISARASFGAGRTSFTEKRSLAAARGSVAAGGRRFALEGGLGGWDYTNGRMPRHTRWRWAFGLGHDRHGAPVGFNLTEGFVGAAECAAFGAAGASALGEPRIAVPAAPAADPWRIAGEGVDLVFTPGAVHAERSNLLLVRSRFLQGVGVFAGTVRLGGEPVDLGRVVGVVEDQDVLW